MSPSRVACAALVVAIASMLLACGGVANNNQALNQGQPPQKPREDAGAQVLPVAKGEVTDGENLGGAQERANIPVNPAENPQPLPQSDLIIEDWRFTVESGYLKVSGEVTNNTLRSLEAVEAVATFYTSDGGFVKTSSALVDYNPILSGQTSPFTVLDTGNPAIASAKITFKYLFGGTINTVERKKLIERQNAAAIAQETRQQRAADERAAAERERFLAAHAAEAPEAWQTLQTRMADGLTPEVREELRAFVDKFEGTSEAKLASDELKAEAKLQLVDNYMKRGLRKPAKNALQQLLKEYPETRAAAEARDSYKGLQ